MSNLELFVVYLLSCDPQMESSANEESKVYRCSVHHTVHSHAEGELLYQARLIKSCRERDQESVRSRAEYPEHSRERLNELELRSTVSSFSLLRLIPL